MTKWKFTGSSGRGRPANTRRGRIALVTSTLLIGTLLASALAPRLQAQVPDVPVAPAAPAAAAPAKNLWSFFCPSPDQVAQCKNRICNSPLGEMLKSAAKPMTLMSGGLLFAKCGIPTAADLAKLKAEGKLDSAEGAAAQIQKSEAEAAARRAAVRYLGTVDCNYWPEAKAALINALRVDPNECVRYEAALALLRGCCCNRAVMEALKHSANGDDKDGFPREDSWRVRDTAAAALAHCASVVVEISEATPELKKLKEAAAPPPVHGKGLLGIFAGAAIVPPYNPVQNRPIAPVGKEPPVVSLPAAPQQTTQHVESNLPYESAQPKYVAPVIKETPAVAVPTAERQATVQPNNNRLFGRIDWSRAKEAASPAPVVTTSAAIPATSAWNSSVQQAAIPSTPSNSGSTLVIVQPPRVPQEPVQPSHGVVMFDVNGVR